jgi:hypothetical protein
MFFFKKNYAAPSRPSLTSKSNNILPFFIQPERAHQYMMDRAAVFQQKLRTRACLQLFKVADAWVLKPDLKSCSSVWKKLYK